MGNSRSVHANDILKDALYISTGDRKEILKKIRNFPVVSYDITLCVEDNQILQFDTIVDVVKNFNCLTRNVNIDILVDGTIHYSDVRDFTIVLVALYNSIIRIRTYTKDPVVITCSGYTCDADTRNILGLQKIKTNTTKYRDGQAHIISSTI